MKKSISLLLAIIMLFSVVSVSAFAATIATPKATSSNDVGGIKVYWNKVDDAVKYNVYRRVGGSSSWVLAGTTTGTQIIDSDVANGKYYVYSVRAYNAQGSYSAYNQNMTYTTKCVATPKLTSLVNDTNGLKLTWSAVSGATYRVYRRGAGSTTWTYLGTTSSTTYTDSKATSGKYWRYTVRAVSSGYYSGFDTNGLYTMRLANPFSIKASQVPGGISITWAKINGATGYRVYRRGAGQNSWTYLGATTGNSVKDTTIEYGENYYRYTVRATRGNIYSGFYSEGSVVKSSKLSVVYSGEIGEINGKVYAIRCIGKHINNNCTCGGYSQGNDTKNIIPVLPTSLKKDNEEFTSFCYYNGYVYYAVEEVTFSPYYISTNRVYRCTPDWKNKQLLAETVYDDNHEYGTDIFVSYMFFIYHNRLYFNNYGYNLSLATGEYSVNNAGLPGYNLDEGDVYCYDTMEFFCFYRESKIKMRNGYSSPYETLVNCDKSETLRLSGGYANGWLYYSKATLTGDLQLRKVNIKTKQDVLYTNEKVMVEHT
ncbi:MAG: hypothetical protein IKV44_02525, partial [Clostridia bacterium]|nr:hypothetical protein [Clostridia bacterium]